MKPIQSKKIGMPDEYLETYPEVGIWMEDGSFHRMKRSGITPPLYKMRAVYMLDDYAHGNPTYVYEGGFFWPSKEWRRANPPTRDV